MNGELVNSCLVPVLQAEGASVQTVEGLALNGELHPLQQHSSNAAAHSAASARRDADGRGATA